MLAKTLAVCVVVGVSLTGAAGAHSAARSRLVVGSGDLVFFSGSDFQCLGFGPAAAQKGGAGIVCWQGPPRQLLAHSLWVDATTARNNGGEGSTGDLKQIFRATIPTHTYRLPLNSRVDVRGTDLACWFQVSHRVDPGHEVILCSDGDARGPLPGSFGVLVSDRLFAFVTIGPNRVVSKITLLHKRRPNQ